MHERTYKDRLVLEDSEGKLKQVKDWLYIHRHLEWQNLFPIKGQEENRVVSSRPSKNAQMLS